MLCHNVVAIRAHCRRPVRRLQRQCRPQEKRQVDALQEHILHDLANLQPACEVQPMAKEPLQDVNFDGAQCGQNFRQQVKSIVGKEDGTGS